MAAIGFYHLSSRAEAGTAPEDRELKALLNEEFLGLDVRYIMKEIVCFVPEDHD